MARLRITREGQPVEGAEVTAGTGDESFNVTDAAGEVDVPLDTDSDVLQLRAGEDVLSVPLASISHDGDGVLVVDIDVLLPSATESGTFSQIRAPIGALFRGRYEIEAVLGQGGMGVVYKARDVELDRSVAIKVLSAELADNPEARRIFETEARLLARVSHENLVSVFDVIRDGNQICLIMEFVDGATLEQVIDRLPEPMELSSALSLALQLLAALCHLHRHGILHRDVKPANVMVDARGHAILTDFGLARRLAVLASRKTRVRGTPAYMAPEQIMGTTLTLASDVYGIGATLYELLAGCLPFPGGDMVYQHLNATPQDIRLRRPELPDAVADVVMRCLVKDPVERPQTAMVVLSELVDATRDLGLVLPPSVLAELGATSAISLISDIGRIVGSDEPMATITTPPPSWNATSPPRQRTGLLVVTILAGALIVTAGLIGSALLLRDGPTDPGDIAAVASGNTTPTATEPTEMVEPTGDESIPGAATGNTNTVEPSDDTEVGSNDERVDDRPTRPVPTEAKPVRRTRRTNARPTRTEPRNRAANAPTVVEPKVTENAGDDRPTREVAEPATTPDAPTPVVTESKLAADTIVDDPEPTEGKSTSDKPDSAASPTPEPTASPTPVNRDGKKSSKNARESDKPTPGERPVRKKPEIDDDKKRSVPFGF